MQSVNHGVSHRTLSFARDGSCILYVGSSRWSDVVCRPPLVYRAVVPTTAAREQRPRLSLLLCVIAACAVAVSASADNFTVLFLPLDERFTTRFAVLNLAAVTPFTMLTPNMSLLPQRKTPAPLDDLIAWVDDNIRFADAAIISSEMFLYGGLIASR